MKKAILIALAISTTEAALLMWLPVDGSTYRLTVRPMLSPGPVMVYYSNEPSALQHDYMMLTPSGTYRVEIQSMTSNVPDGKLQILLTNEWVSPYDPTVILRPRPPQGLRILP